MVSSVALAEPASPPSRSLRWQGGCFEWGMRPMTANVSSQIASEEPILLVTLEGGARRIRQKTDDGLFYDGPDIAGSFTFLPAGCLRELEIASVAWRWATITVHDQVRRSVPRAVHMRQDTFLRDMLRTLRDIAVVDQALDAAYCETASVMAAHHLRQRYADGKQSGVPTARLNRQQLGRIEDYVVAHLSEPIRIAQLAGLLDLSEGHFHRAFAQTTGMTPLQWMTARRIEVAKGLLEDLDQTVLDIALTVGIASPSRFARQFRQITGLSPRAYRDAFFE